jgi:hypothetical protein
VEAAAVSLGGTLPDFQGRALRRVVGMQHVGEALVSGRLVPARQARRRPPTSEPRPLAPA